MPDPTPYTLQPYRTERSLFVAGFFSIYRGGEWFATVKSEELAERIVWFLNAELPKEGRAAESESPVASSNPAAPARPRGTTP